MNLTLLELQGISKSFGSLKALQNVSLSVEAGSIVGLIGPNGSGKSTSFDIVSGFQEADSGTVTFQGRRLNGCPPHAISRAGLIRTFQLSEGGQRLTAIENLLAAAQDQIELNLIAAAFDVRRLLKRERVDCRIGDPSRQ